LPRWGDPRHLFAVTLWRVRDHAQLCARHVVGPRLGHLSLRHHLLILLLIAGAAAAAVALLRHPTRRNRRQA
jgi:hypothetical protein